MTDPAGAYGAQTGRQDVPTRYPAEPQDLMNFLGRTVANQQLNGVLRLRGLLEEDRLRRALRRSLDLQPVLGCRFVEDPERPHWERRSDLDSVELCPVVACDAAGQEAELWRFVTAPTDPRHDLPVRATLLRGSSDTLCVKVDHVAADATATRQYIALLADLYATLGPDGESEPAGVSGAAMDRGQGQALRTFDRETLGRIGAEFRGGGSPAFGWPPAASASSDVAFSIRRVAPARLRTLKDLGRARGATLNDVLLAAYYRALIELLDPAAREPLPVQVPVDMRRYLPGKSEAAICNLSSAMWPAITRESAATFDSALAAVTRSTVALKAQAPGVGAALFVGQVFGQPYSEAVAQATQAMALGGGRSHPYLSNLGVLTLCDRDESGAEAFGDRPIADAFLVSPALYPPAFMIGVSTFAETLTLTVGYPSDADTAALVERLLDLMDADLPA
jgi:NRPS condensation-like uncharacterized protein